MTFLPFVKVNITGRERVGLWFIVIVENFFKPTKKFLWEDNFVRKCNNLYYNNILDNDENELAKTQYIFKRLKHNPYPRSIKSRETQIQTQGQLKVERKQKITTQRELYWFVFAAETMLNFGKPSNSVTFHKLQVLCHSHFWLLQVKLYPKFDQPPNILYSIKPLLVLTKSDNICIIFSYWINYLIKWDLNYLII